MLDHLTVVIAAAALALAPARAVAQPADPAAPAPAPAAAQPVEGPRPSDPAVLPRRFVVGNDYGVTFGVSPIPSGEVSLFLGGTVHAAPASRRVQALAVGYRGTASLGAADWPIFSRLDCRYCMPLLVHRHHVAVQGFAGRRGDLAFEAGLGVFAGGRRFGGLEGQARVGYLFSWVPRTHVRGIVGGQLRLGGVFGYTPAPEFGLYLGFVRTPLDPDPSRLPHMTRKTGLGMLIPGVLLTAAGLSFTAVAIADFAGGPENWLGFAFILPGVLALGSGVPLLAVGAVRHHRYRARRSAVHLAPSGLALSF